VRCQSQQRGGAPAEAEDRAALAAVGTAAGAGGDWVAGAMAGDGDAKAEAARGAGEPPMGGSRWMDGRGRPKARADAWAAAYGRRHTRTACGSPMTEERGRRAGGCGWGTAGGDGSTAMEDGSRDRRPKEERGRHLDRWSSQIRDGRRLC